jgi:hypothetical protein
MRCFESVKAKGAATQVDDDSGESLPQISSRACFARKRHIIV